MEASTASPPPQAAKGKPASGYMVLALTPSKHWQLVGTNVAARTAEAAIRAHAAKNPKVKNPATTEDDFSQVLVAIPARSWQPVRVTPKITTTLELKDAS